MLCARFDHATAVGSAVFKRVGKANSGHIRPGEFASELGEGRFQQEASFSFFVCSGLRCASGLLPVPAQREGPGRDPTALTVAEEAAGTSVQRKGAVQPAGRNATMRLGFAKSAKR